MTNSTLFIIVLSSLLSIGCSSQTQQPLPLADYSFASASSIKPGFNPSQGQTFAWHADPAWTNPQMASANPNINYQLISAINNSLISKGYRITDNKNQSDYIIGLALITDDNERSEEINQFFLLFPGLAESSTGYDKGVIIAGVVKTTDAYLNNTKINPQSVLWRSAVEAYILADHIKPEQRAHRLTSISNILMENFPQ